MSKHNNNMADSATKCWGCKRKLSIAQDVEGCRYCPDCSYFNAIGVHSIQDYNNWLKK